jgi:hypothetical protein
MSEDDNYVQVHPGDKRMLHEEIKTVMNPAVAHVLKFFAYDHLPPHLQAVSKPFSDLAQQVATLADNPEITVALRKLLESKDAAVRSVL